MSVKLHEIMGAAHARSASLAAEVAGYLVLAAADQLAGAPRRLGFGDVALSEEGQVRIGAGIAAEDGAAEQALREMLGLMLQVSSSVTPGLLRTAHKPSGAGVDALIREIEVALVPVNRAAARRALARLHRDVTRALESGRVAAWEAPRTQVVVAAPPPAAVAPPAPAPSPKVEPTGGLELVAVLSRDSHPPALAEAERSWLTPDTVAVVDVEWPGKEPVKVEEELLTVIPVYVEEPEPSPLGAVPVVPDLEVPPSDKAPPVRAATQEPVTVPQPLVAPVQRAVASLDGRSGRTPVLGSTLAVLDPGPLEISEPTPGVLVLHGDDATERMPSVEELELVARADDALETLDPPPAARAAVAMSPPPPTPVPSPRVADAVLSTPSPVAEVMAALEPSPPVQAVVVPEPSPVVWNFAEPSPSPLPRVSPQAALDRLAALPARPARHDYAPPRYAPRKSDIEDLLSGFGVADAKSERELCSDLKALAGVDQTAPPPRVELSETPPPVAVVEMDEAVAGPSPRAAQGSSARVVAGAVSAALVVAGVGLGSIPNRDPEVTAAAARAPMGSPTEENVAPCSAELTVRQVPTRSRTRVRSGDDGSVIAPSRVVGTDAVFEGLACRQSAEVTVELPGRARWVRIPVAADALSPSAEAPSLVRYTVALR